MPDTVADPLRITRLINASPERVFRAWTDPTQISQWLSPHSDIKQVVTETEARAGGAYRFGFANPQTGHVNTVEGRYLEIIPHTRLVFTWAWQAPHDEFPDEFLTSESTVTVELSEIEGKTQLTLTHERLPLGPIADRHAWGWNGTLDQLDIFLGEQ